MTCGYLPGRIRIGTIVSVAALLCVLLASSQPASAQHLSASGSVTITAVVRGSVTVNVRSVPLSFAFDPADPAANYAAFPVTVTWNMNPTEVQGFQVIGYFANSAAALLNPENGATVPSSHVLGRMNSGPFRAFGDTSEVGPPGGSLTLMRQSVVTGAARGTRSSLLEMRLDQENLPDLPKGNYEGMLYIEVRHY